MWHWTIGTSCLHSHVWNISVIRKDARQYSLNMWLVTGGNKQDLRGLCWQQPPVWSWNHSLFGSPACTSTQAESPLCVQKCSLLIKLVPFRYLYFLALLLCFTWNTFWLLVWLLISPIQLYAYFITLILSSGGASLLSLQWIV